MTTVVPGPKPAPVIGSAYSIDTENLVQSAERMAKKYGKFYQHQIPGRPPLYIITSQQVMHQIADESRFYKVVHPAISNVRPFAGNGLFTAETADPEWEKAHRILMPGFSPLALRGMYEDMAEMAEQLLLKWTRTRDDEKITVTDDFTRLTLDTIALTSFSYRFNSFYSEDLHPFVHAMVGALYESGRRAHAIDIQKKLMVISQRKWDGYVELMHNLVDDLIVERRENPHDDDSWDLLDVMLNAEDPETGEKISDKNMRYQLVSFLVAGHETTSGFLSFALYELLTHPEALKKARAEVDDALDGKFPELEDLPKLRYMDQVFRETLRLHPTAPGFSVTPFETTTIDTPVGEVEVEPGDTLFVLLAAMQQDPDAWDHPEEFDPERFAPENADKILPHAWVPFGNGQRSCIGRAFALQESMIVMSLLLQHLDIEMDDPDYTLRIKETLTVKPLDFKIKVNPREGREFHGRGVHGGNRGIDTGNTGGSLEVNEEGPAYGQAIKVFVGSKAGTSRSFAEEFAAQGRGYGFDVSVTDLDNAVENLSTEHLNIIFTSSYEGLPPDNAKKFVDWLTGGGEASTDSQPDLSGVDFAVYGLGNKQWSNSFQRVPTLVDEAMEGAGAHRIYARGAADVTEDFQDIFLEWEMGIWGAIAEHTGTELPEFRPDSILNVDIIDDGRTRHLRHDDQQPMVQATVVSNDVLSTDADGDIEEKRAVRLRLPEDTTFEIGDYLEVLPRNSQRQVDRVLDRFGISGDQRIWLSGNNSTLPLNSAVPVETLFRDYLELSQPATRGDLKALADGCPCPPEAEELRKMAAEPEFSRKVLIDRLSVLDVLEKYRSITVSLPDFIQMLPAMATRRYSISSSPLAGENEAQLTFSVVSGEARSGHGHFEGVTSNYLAQTEPGSHIAVAVDAGPEYFNPPAAIDEPMLLIGAGSGMAPLRAFIEDVEKRAEDADVKPAKNLLFYGCHGPESDLLFSQEIKNWSDKGLVDLRTAYSRHPEGSVADEDAHIRYVQDRLRHDAADVDEALRTGAKVLVCGDAEKLRDAVAETLTGIIQEQRGVSADEAAVVFNAMEAEEHTYVSDLFT